MWTEFMSPIAWGKDGQSISRNKSSPKAKQISHNLAAFNSFEIGDIEGIVEHLRTWHDFFFL